MCVDGSRSVKINTDFQNKIWKINTLYKLYKHITIIMFINIAKVSSLFKTLKAIYESKNHEEIDSDLIINNVINNVIINNLTILIIYMDLNIYLSIHKKKVLCIF